jgi:serine/threonine-protein kinase
LSISTGTRLGSLEIIALLGKGGMGEVYRARDLKLKRDVAIKILPEEFSSDPDRLSRFQREAEVLASLNHPNVGGIYDLQEADSYRFLVLELVEGETLADRIARGPIAVEEALDIATHICEAIEAAHERNVIHRDLKPANVKITPDGKVKVLDFGLAKAGNNSPTGSTLSNSPTLLSGTVGGMILGTAAYMSPEQAKGRVADKRSDIWAFGCILYEMFTGKMAFAGEDISDTLAAVLRAEPDWAALPASLSPCVPALIEGCLRKDRRVRIGDISTARFLMSAPAGLLQTTSAPQRKSWRALALPITISALAVAVIIGIGMWRSSRSRTLSVSRSTFLLPAGQNFTTVTLPLVDISADGSQIVYVAKAQLHTRLLSNFDSKPITGPGDSAAASPAFSPDGRFIAFYNGTEHTIKRISTSGGSSVAVCSVDNAPYGITWSAEYIAFAAPGTGIMRVPAKGGNPELLVRLNAGEEASAPQFLMDADAVLFTLTSSTGSDKVMQSQIVVQSLKTGERKALVPSGVSGRYIRTGHIIYASLSPSGGGTLLAVPFDVKRMQLTGQALPIVEGVRRGGGNTIAQFSVSETGTLVYVPGPPAGSSVQQDLALVDRKGGVEPLKLPPTAYQHPRVSPDGKHVAYSIDDGKEANIWVYDFSGTIAPRRVTFGGRNRFPVWSGDGQRIAFQSDREGDAAIYSQRADINGNAERLTKPEPGTAHIPESWSSPRDDTLLFTVTRESTVALWTLSLRDKRATEFPGVGRSSTPTDAVFSPDGRWVAYVTTGEGHPGPYVQPRDLHLYVQPFPPTGEKNLISQGSGIHPAWSDNGRELLFNYPGLIMTSSVSTHPVFSFTPPVQLLRGAIIAMPWPAQRDYDIMPDGKLIGVITSRENAAEPLPPQIRIVLNWFEELKQQVPVQIQ